MKRCLARWLRRVAGWLEGKPVQKEAAVQPGEELELVAEIGRRNDVVVCTYGKILKSEGGKSLLGLDTFFQMKACLVQGVLETQAEYIVGKVQELQSKKDKGDEE